MRNWIRRLEEGPVHIGVDTKMKMLDRGMGIATLSVFTKAGLRNTSMHTLQSGRTQGLAHATHAVPVLQAIIHAETISNYVRLFQCMCHVWKEERPGDHELPEVVTQVHKDFHASIEGARVAVFPKSRPCDDYFHWKEKQRTLEKKCARLVHVHSQFVKDRGSASKISLSFQSNV